jgi:radical SAM superfamily enzyme YgiQ (UPF0313 family)
MNILLVYPEFPDTFWSFKHALSFIHKKASSPPLGLVTVAAMLPPDWNKKLIDVNVTKLLDKDILWADYIFLSAMVVQRSSAQDIISRSKALGAKIIAGGPLFTGEHEDFLDVDHFVLNEAEITLPPFLEDLNSGSPKKCYATSDYANLNDTPIPLWDLIDSKKYDSLSIQFTRGCPYNCDFCNVTALLGHKVRTKSAAQIIAELDKIYSLGWHRSIFFVDDNFIGNKKLLKEEILPALIEWRKGKVGCGFITEASINLADDIVLMDMMTMAGFKSVFVGIETPDEASLSEAHKSQNTNRNLVESVKRLQRAGLQVMGGFIVGFDNDSPSIFSRQIDFIQKSGIVTAMVGLLQAPYGTKLYDRMANEDRLLDEMSGDNVDGTTNIIPKMDIETLKSGYHEILNQIYSPKLFHERVKNFLSEYNPRRAPVHLHPEELMALLRSIFRLGIRNKERIYYWRLFFWTLFHHPKNFPLAITFSIYGYHFRKVKDSHVI